MADVIHMYEPVQKYEIKDSHQSHGDSDKYGTLIPYHMPPPIYDVQELHVFEKAVEALPKPS